MSDVGVSAYSRLTKLFLLRQCRCSSSFTGSKVSVSQPVPSQKSLIDPLSPVYCARSVVAPSKIHLSLFFGNVISLFAADFNMIKNNTPCHHPAASLWMLAINYGLLMANNKSTSTTSIQQLSFIFIFHIQQCWNSRFLENFSTQSWVIMTRVIMQTSKWNINWSAIEIMSEGSCVVF